jgi:hypothetical protein
MSPVYEIALIQARRHQLRQESEGTDVLYLQFASDPLSLGLLICPLTGGGSYGRNGTRLISPNDD